MVLDALYRKVEKALGRPCEHGVDGERDSERDQDRRRGERRGVGAVPRPGLLK